MLSRFSTQKSRDLC